MARTDSERLEAVRYALYYGLPLGRSRDDGLATLAELWATVEKDRDTLLSLLFVHTRVCPFGGGKDGMRTSCKFGHPGCACNDWLAEHVDVIEEMTAALADAGGEGGAG